MFSFWNLFHFNDYNNVFQINPWFFQIWVCSFWFLKLLTLKCTYFWCNEGGKTYEDTQPGSHIIFFSFTEREWHSLEDFYIVTICSLYLLRCTDLRIIDRFAWHFKNHFFYKNFMQFGTSSTSKTLTRSMIFLIVTDRFETKFFFIKLFSGVFKHTSEVYMYIYSQVYNIKL